MVNKNLIYKIILIILSGVMLTLSFYAARFSGFIFIGFIPLFFAISGATLKQAFIYAYGAGVLFFLGLIFWLRHVTSLGTVLLALYLALYFALFGIAVYFWLKKKSFLFIPCVFVVIEFIRSYLSYGFGWGLLGYSQYQNLGFIQIAEITGVWGVTFLIMLANIFVFKLLIFLKQGKKDKHTNQAAVYGFLVVIIIFSAVFAYGRACLAHNNKTNNQIKISVIQGNIPQEEKWDENFIESILVRYATLTLNAAKESPELIIWPETSLPAYWETDIDVTRRIKEMVKYIKTPLMFGAPFEKQDDSSVCFNSAILLSANADTLNFYNKVHLVPFGEYIPFEKALGFIRKFILIGDFTAGKDFTLFNLNDKKFSVLICFEDVLPSLVAKVVKKGPDFLVNITNDAWFKKSAEPYQHLANSVFRAIENRRPMIRAANTGVSGFIDKSGRLYSRVNKNGQDICVEGYITADVNIYEKQIFTIYNRFGDWFVWACALVAGLIILKTNKFNSLCYNNTVKKDQHGRL